VNERLARKKLAYQRTFMDDKGRLLPFASEVIADLRKLCRVDAGGLVVSPVSKMVDSHATIYSAGQRDVFLRIVKYLELPGFHEEKSNDRPEPTDPD
jgi:hypothetical protein